MADGRPGAIVTKTAQPEAHIAWITKTVPLALPSQAVAGALRTAPACRVRMMTVTAQPGLACIFLVVTTPVLSGPARSRYILV